MRTLALLLQVCLLAAPLCLIQTSSAVEVHGELDLRLPTGNTDWSWTRGGLGKMQYDNSFGAAEALRGTLRMDADVYADVAAVISLNANGDRAQAIDLQEAWLGWNPVPTGHWRTRLKLGAFFPPGNLEVGYDDVTWTPGRTLSSSAINSWLGEELRTNGLELAFLRRGVFVGSPHDFGVTLAVFGGNDPAGTLLGWRGWTVGDRVTGLTEPLLLADLPAYRPGGEIPLQTRHIHEFRELDGRPGYYAALTYAWSGKIDAMLLHYDSRGDPLVVMNGQYSWHTRFDHLSIRASGPGGWQFLLQAMLGSTLMGPRAVNVRFKSAYLLASHALGPGQITIRGDVFRITENDAVPSDPNAEQGHAFAVAYQLPIGRTLNVVTEALQINSTRPARTLLGTAPKQLEHSLSVALSWVF